jgi:nitroreductase
MDFDAVVKQRRSVRGFFRERSVPKEVLQAALELAQRSPSNCNAQPWRVFIASGKRRDLLSKELVTAARERSSSSPLVDNFTGIYRKRQIECAVEMYGHMGIERHDLEGRLNATLRNYQFFDAPHVAIICMDASFGISVALNVGIYVQTLMLALESRGVASCAQAALARFPDVTRRVLEIPEELLPLCGISLGYEDPSVPANRTRQARQTVEENVVVYDD